MPTHSPRVLSLGKVPLSRLSSQVVLFISRQLWSRRDRKDEVEVIFASDTIGQHITMLGVYEEEELSALTSTLEDWPGFVFELFLDVGANIGNHSRYFAPKFKKVVAYEPSALTFLVFNANLRNFDNVECRNIGLGSECGESWMEIVPGNRGASHLVSPDTPEESIAREVVSISTLDLEDFGPWKPSLVKIDTEGYELDVIRGARKVIEAYRPFVVFEQSESDFTSGTTPVIDLLESHGYKIGWLDGIEPYSSGLIRRFMYSFVHLFRGRSFIFRFGGFPVRSHQMLLAVPEERFTDRSS